MTLTSRGRDLLESRQRNRGDQPRQAFHSGLMKPRELAHDSQLYRTYLRATERLQEREARICRVILDVELKREYQRFLQERNRGRSDSDGRPDREVDEIREWAFGHELPYEDGHVQFPDVRIEYEDIDGRTRFEDVEVTTLHYRGAHAAAKARARFSRYRVGSARIVAGRGSSGSGRAPFDPRVTEELL